MYKSAAMILFLLTTALSPAHAGSRHRHHRAPAAKHAVQHHHPRHHGRVKAGWTQTGIASFYGKKFAHHKTASGAPFNMWAFTAAHRTLPLGSKVRITVLESGETADLTINDRGPYVGQRIIDLSEGVARFLGIRKEGTAKVRIEVLHLPPDWAGAAGVN